MGPLFLIAWMVASAHPEKNLATSSSQPLSLPLRAGCQFAGPFPDLALQGTPAPTVPGRGPSQGERLSGVPEPRSCAMFFGWWRKLVRVESRPSRRDSRKPPHLRRGYVKPWAEVLEDRLAPALTVSLTAP